MPMRLQIQGVEADDHAAFLGADTDFNIRLLGRDGADDDIDITAPAYALLQFYEGETRDSVFKKAILVTPVAGKEDSGFGTASIANGESVLSRKQYFVWALYDDGTGDSGKIGLPVISTAGLGYEANPTIGVDNTNTLGGTLGAITAAIKGGIKTAITITNGGTGYTVAPTLSFNTPPGGTPATATCTVSSGVIVSVTVTSPGTGYTVANPPVCTITPVSGGTGAVLTAAINGFIDTLTISNVGTGYKMPPTLTVTPVGVAPTTPAVVSVGVLRGKAQISESASSITIH